MLLGIDPFELRNRLTGSTCRGPMEPPFAMAEINLFGEVGVLKTINSLTHQFWVRAEIPVGVTDMNMPKVGRQYRQTRLDLLPATVPVQ